jgi:tyramine---L-glutamate ligase
MTRVFVFEFTSSRPIGSQDAAGAALNAEGEAMRTAALDDFGQIPGVVAFTTDRVSDEEAAFRKAAGSADWSLVIAPEFNDILLDRCRWVQEEHGRLLGPPPDIVRLCSDKLALASHWATRGVPTPPTFPITETTSPPGAEWIVKPRFGAGSQDTSLNGALRPGGLVGPMIVQPYVAGLAASVAFLCGPRHRVALIATEQLLSSDGHFHYLGGRLPLDEKRARRAGAIADRAIATIPNLCGYVSVDVLLGADGRDWAIEINPRLTTSYIGLRALATTNLAEAMLRIAQGLDPPSLGWRGGVIEFSASGRTSV